MKLPIHYSLHGRKRGLPYVSLKTQYSVALIFLSSIVIWLGAVWLSPGPASVFLDVVAKQPLLFLLNYLPILAAIVFLFFLANSATLGITLTGTVVAIASIVNREKVTMRQDPFQPIDLTLFTEAAAVLKKFSPAYLCAIGALILILAALVIGLTLFLRSAPMKRKVRIGGVLALVLLGGVASQTVYRSDSIYDSFYVEGNIYFHVNQYISKGFLYSFLHDATKQVVEKPEGYQTAQYKEAEESFSTPQPEDKTYPHIIMVMGESFSDICDSPLIDFEGYPDPLENWRRISKEENAISGHIVVSGFGGGTSNTEFDVLTACNTRYLNNALASYSFIRSDFPALPNLLKETAGYASMAIHPGFSWFYNRHNVYQFFGFDEMHFWDEFDPVTQNKTGYISDEAVTGDILERFERHLEQSDAPLFTFCVTIQNHGPYEGRYGAEQNFHAKVPLTEQEYNIYSNFFEGLSDADRQVGQLVEAFRDSDEPIVFVYFGDHLPGFTNGMDFYDKLAPHINIEGTTEERLNQYSTPFLIWQNDAAKALSDIPLQAAKDGIEKEGSLMTSSFLGAALLDWMGLEEPSALFRDANEARKILPVMANSSFMRADGTFTETLTEEEEKIVDRMRGWSYYEVMDRKRE